jgi:hypothetical protein
VKDYSKWTFQESWRKTSETVITMFSWIV